MMNKALSPAEVALREAARDYHGLPTRGNLVGVITSGTAVLGLGNSGLLAAKPVMEGKGWLFKKFAGIDVFDIELSENGPDKLVKIIAAMEPTLDGLNLFWSQINPRLGAKPQTVL